jgi:hypothetical protein
VADSLLAILPQGLKVKFWIVNFVVSAARHVLLSSLRVEVQIWQASFVIFIFINREFVLIEECQYMIRCSIWLVSWSNTSCF